MIIVDFGHFHVVEQDIDYQGVLFYENEDGLDWYDLRAGLTNWEPARGQFRDAVFGAFAAVDSGGVVTNVEYNPSKIVPDDKTVLGIDAHHKDIKPGMIWDGKKLLPPTEESLRIIGPPLS